MNFQKILFIVFTVSLIFTSCNKSKELSDAIPADANYVVHVNTKALADKSQYDIFSNTTVQQGVNIYKVLLKDEDKIKILDEFLKNSNSIGIDMKGELYMYTNYKVFGMVVGVNDAKKIKDILVKFSLASEEDIKQQDGIYTISPETQVSVAWDDSRLIVVMDLSSAYGTSAEPVNVSELSLAQLKQSSDKSINSNKSYIEFAKEKKDLSFFYSMKGLADLPAMKGQLGDDIMAPFKNILKDMDGVSAALYTSFEKGEITMSSKYYYDTPEDEKKFKDYAAKVSGNLKGDQLKYITSDPLLVASLNIKGEGLYDYLKNMGFAEMINNELPDSIQPEQIEKLVKSFNGDITFAVTSIEKKVLKISEFDDITGEQYEDEITTPIPQISLFADVSDSEFVLSFIKELLNKNGESYKELAANSYLYTQKGISVYFGVNNNTFFLTNVESVYNSLNSSDLKNNYADLIKGKMALISGDLQVLKPYMEGQSDLTQFVTVLNQFGKFQATTSSDDFSGNGKLEMTNKEKNSLAVICEQLDQLISSIGSSMRF